MKKILLGLLFVFIVSAVIGTYLQNASAIPPFARKYKTNCQTCHTAFPKLNPFGMAFRANGERFPTGDDVFVKDEPISMGADANKRLWPRATWPSDLPYLPPIALTMFSNLYIGEDTETTTEFDGIEEIGILAGGTLGESFSFFLDYRLYMWGPDNGWLDRAFITYTPRKINEKLGEYATRLFNIDELEYPEGILNVRMGQFEPRATPMLGGHRNLITIKGTPNAVAYPVAPSGEFTNFWGFFPNQKGIEFFGALNGPKGRGGFEWAAGIVNGGEAINEMLFGGIDGNRPDRDNGRFDNDDYKDYYGRISYKIGGLGVMGGGVVEESDTALENWQDGEIIFGNIATSAKIGVFYYRGKMETNTLRGGITINNDRFVRNGNVQIDNTNRFTRWGVDLDWIIGNANIIGSAVYFRDRLDEEIIYNRGFEIDDTFETAIYTAELDYVIFPWLMPAVRYEWIQPKYSVTGNSSFAPDRDNPTTSGDREMLTFDVAILAAVNIKLLAGGTFSIGNAPQSGSHFRDYFRLGINIDF